MSPRSNPQESPRPKAPPSLQEKLDQARRDVVKWSRIAADPELSLPAALAARNMARSSQAAVTLYEKALAYQQESNQNLARIIYPPCKTSSS
jgi:hypothetical protein